MSDKEPTQNVETQSDSISMQEQMQSMMQLMQQQMELQQQQFDALRQQMELQQQQFDVFCQELKEVKAEIKEVKEGQSLLRAVVDNFKREFNRFKEFTENGINSLNNRVKNIETGINKGFTDLTNNTKELGAQLYGKINDYTLSIGEGLVSIKKEVMKPIEITQTVMKEMKEKRVEEEKDKLVEETIKILRFPENTSWEGTIGDYTIRKRPNYFLLRTRKLENHFSSLQMVTLIKT